MIRSIFVGCLFIIMGTHISAQSGSILSVPIDTRSISLGNTYLTSSSSNGIYTNMAAYALEDNKIDVGYNYRPWITNISDGYSFNSFTAGYSAGFKHYFSIGYKKFTKPDFDLTDDYGNVLESYSPQDYSIGLGYAYKLNSTSALSVTFNYINSDLSKDYSASTYYVDLGFKSKVKQLDYGVMVRNLGAKLSYPISESVLPLTFAAGVGYTKDLSENHSIRAQFDASYINGDENEKGQAVGLGLEYAYLSRFNVRTGYFNSHKDVGISFYSLGGGVRLGGFCIDLAYLIADNALKNNYSLSISWKM
ncbi:PorV/PorQ family protein [Carboxylicivirga linearis]|uniref:PorV/PorQ family protein n=2 Tax=Carboxylicivirga linearis TaxID=1628157 RepID=A0ABS5JY76_9BACT|nr:PorV/PorQ family protein [Carboxylicivirga linearis]